MFEQQPKAASKNPGSLRDHQARRAVRQPKAVSKYPGLRPGSMLSWAEGPLKKKVYERIDHRPKADPSLLGSAQDNASHCEAMLVGRRPSQVFRPQAET